MSKKNSKYPRFTPVSVETHPIVGKIKIYEFKRFPSTNGDGCQSSFFLNGAKMNKAKEFGIKIFNTSIEAFAAYQRQKIAAKAHLAPPVGVMVRWIIRNEKGTVNRWGYETAIADVSKTAIDVSVVKSNTVSMEDYENFMRGFAPKNKLYTPHSIRTFWETVAENEDAFGYSYFSLNDNYADAYGSLAQRLSVLDISGTQYDDITEVDDLGNAAWKNTRLRLGEVIDRGDEMWMGGDLHQENIGLWQGRVVAIDFGYHCCCPYYRFSPQENYRSFKTSEEVISLGRSIRERHSQIAA